MTHEDYMKRAIELAKKGVGWTSPNPMVGAVIVKDGRIIGEGYHERCGQKHAERNAFAALSEPAVGATIYVTLEPCCHYGKQPPCTDAIIENGISKVYIGSRDPNPLVSGKGVQILKDHGIEVVEDFLRDECDEINDIFFHYITSNRPYVLTKYAMTLDGKIATKTGKSKWITGETARAHVQSLRGRYSSILAGIGTVLADDPMLNCRIEGAHQPLRVIVDSKLRIPLNSQLVNTAKEYPTLVAYADGSMCEEGKIAKLEEAGVELVSIPDSDGKRVDVNKLMDTLAEMKIDSVLVEGGGEVHDAFREAGLIDAVACYIAPKIFGGSQGKTPVGGKGIDEVSDAALFENIKVTHLGDDILIEAKKKKS